MKLFDISDISSPIKAIGDVFDKLFTSDEEKLQAKAVFEKLKQHPAELQVELNKIEAQHRSVFVAGWRPFIGWICGMNLLYLVIVRDLIVWMFSIYAPDLPHPPAAGLDLTIELVIALLGLSTLRTYEKLKGKTK